MTMVAALRNGLAAAVAGAVLGACGQTGPLYLPGNPSEVQVETPGGEAATDSLVDDEQAEDDENGTRE